MEKLVGDGKNYRSKYGMVYIPINTLCIPIDLSEREFDTLKHEVRRMYKRFEQNIFGIQIFLGNYESISINRRSHEGKERIFIDGFSYFASCTSKTFKEKIREIIDGTIIGKKLEEYWIEEEKISPEKSRERKKEITKKSFI